MRMQNNYNMSIVNSKRPFVDWKCCDISKNLNLHLLKPDLDLTDCKLNLWKILSICLYLFNAYLLLV